MGNFYKGNYRLFFILPLILFVFFAFTVFVSPKVSKGIDLKGGTLIIIRSDKAINAGELDGFLKKNFSLNELSVTSISSPTGFGALIQFSENKDLVGIESIVNRAFSLEKSNPDEAKKLADNALVLLKEKGIVVSDKPEDLKGLLLFVQSALDEQKSRSDSLLERKIASFLKIEKNMVFQKKEIKPSLGRVFWNNAVFVGIVSFILVTIAIFFFFREIVPSIAVLLAAIFDVVCALSFMAIAQIPLSLASIPSLLMLIGYSIDTDIMLTGRLLKQKDQELRQTAHDSMLTGLTMTTTTLVALAVMLILSYYYQVSVIFEIAIVLFFGLLGDIPATWLMNAPMLLWYLEAKEKKRHKEN